MMKKAKVLLCYLLAWGLAAALPALALWRLYPYKLAGSAPNVAATLDTLPVALPSAVQAVAARATLSPDLSREALQAALDARDLLWRCVVGACVALAWLACLLVQLRWRAMYRRPSQPARAVLRAIRGYRARMALCWLICLACAAAVYLLGVRAIPDRTLWDWLIYFGGFPPIPLAAFVCFRFAAPSAISGTHAFFRR